MLAHTQVWLPKQAHVRMQACMCMPAHAHMHAHLQVSACMLAFSIWVLGNVAFPGDLARKLHFHALWQLILALIKHPWLTCRSCEWGEHSFYTEASAQHVAVGAVLGQLTLHRWKRSMQCKHTGHGKANGTKKNFIGKALAEASQPLPFPVLPATLSAFQGGAVSTRFEQALAPLLAHHKLQWRNVTNGVDTVRTVVPLACPDDDPVVKTALQAARGCLQAIGEGMQPAQAHVGAPRAKHAIEAKVPHVAAHGAQLACGPALCTMLHCATAQQWPFLMKDTGILRQTYPPQAWEKRPTLAKPTLADDILQERYERWATNDGPEEAPPMTDEQIIKWTKHLGLKKGRSAAARLTALRKHFASDAADVDQKDSDDSDRSEGAGT